MGGDALASGSFRGCARCSAPFISAGGQTEDDDDDDLALAVEEMRLDRTALSLASGGCFEKVKHMKVNVP